MIKILTWIFDKRVRNLSKELEDELFRKEQLQEHLNKLNNDLYKLNRAYRELDKKFKTKNQQVEDLREQLVKQKEKTAHYIELYLEATKD